MTDPSGLSVKVVSHRSSKVSNSSTVRLGCFFDCKASCIGMLHTSLFAWQSLHKHLPWKLYGKIQSWLGWQHFCSRPNGTVVKIEICMRSNSGTPLLALLNFLVFICRKVKDYFVFSVRWVTKTSEWQVLFQFIFVKTKVLVTFFVQMITQITVGFELQHESCDSMYETAKIAKQQPCFAFNGQE